MSGQRGTLARLGALEDRARARVAAVKAAKEETAMRAADRLTPADLATMYEHLDAQEAGGEWWAEVCRTLAALEGPPLEDPAGEAARAWGQATEDTPEGVPYPLPPAGAVAYFEREAARCDLVKADAPGIPLTDGLKLEAVQAAARWSAAGWRFEAAFAREVGERVQA